MGRGGGRGGGAVESRGHVSHPINFEKIDPIWLIRSGMLKQNKHHCFNPWPFNRRCRIYSRLYFLLAQ